jgi:hypothetical protein
MFRLTGLRDDSIPIDPVHPTRLAHRAALVLRRYVVRDTGAIPTSGHDFQRDSPKIQERACEYLDNY